jgi:hypothetical protein
MIGNLQEATKAQIVFLKDKKAKTRKPLTS